MAKNKKADILKAAYDLFIKNGYDNTSMPMIARQAGTPQSHIYNFYKNKDDLFLGVFSLAQDNFQDKMAAVAVEFKDTSPDVYLSKFV